MAANKFPSSLMLLTCFLIFVSLFSSSYAYQDCTDHPLHTKNIYTNCETLPTTDSFLHWNYHQSNNTVDIAYRQNSGQYRDRWIAWCLNPSGDGLFGSECLVAYGIDNYHSVTAYTSVATPESYGTWKYLSYYNGPLSFSVPKIGGEYIDNYNEIIIYATLELPKETTTFTQVAQYGSTSSYSFGKPPFPTYIGTINFAVTAPAPGTAAPTPTMDTITNTATTAPTTDTATAPIADTGLLGSIKSQKIVCNSSKWNKADTATVVWLSLCLILTVLVGLCHFVLERKHQQQGDNVGSSCCV